MRKEFFIIRHPEVDKKHPMGEAAPLTDKGVEQVTKLIEKFKEERIGLIVVSAEDIPRFSDTAAMMESAGFSVRRADNICFKDMKGKAPIVEIVTKYRDGGMALVSELTEDSTTPDKIAIIGSWPLVSGMKLLDWQFTRATEDRFGSRPDFCTGAIFCIYDGVDGIGKSTFVNPAYRPLDEDDSEF